MTGLYDEFSIQGIDAWKSNLMDKSGLGERERKQVEETRNFGECMVGPASHSLISSSFFPFLILMFWADRAS